MSEELKMIGFRAGPAYLTALKKVRKQYERTGDEKIRSDSDLLRVALRWFAADLDIVLPDARPPVGGSRPGAGRKKVLAK